MLVRFNVRNFLSFYERNDPETGKPLSHEFSMIPGKVRLNPEHIIYNKKQDILKMAAIYGANASGKSNLTKALRFFQKIVVSGKFPVGATEKYSKIRVENINKPSYFECEILIDDELYAYGFEVILSQGVVESEWLTKLSKDSQIDLFYKNGKNDKYHFNDSLKNIRALDIYQEGMQGSNSLFLYEMNKNKQGFYNNNTNALILNKIFNWIRNNLEIISPNIPVDDVSFLINSTSLKKVADLLNSFDTGIVAINEIQEDPGKVLDTIPPQIRKDILQRIEMFIRIVNLKKDNTKRKGKWHWNVLLRNRNDLLGIEIREDLKPQAFSLQFNHKNIDSNLHFRISEESDGTARLFELIEILLSDKEKTYIIDELDRCLHPCLTYKFIQNFFEYTKNKKIQLIVTTHESRLLDFKLLRRDEIWFVDKDKFGNSNIYSLEEYNTRFDKKIDKAYLEGRYGGVPLFTTLFPLGENT